MAGEIPNLVERVQFLHGLPIHLGTEAQKVERRSEKPCVAGSIPARPTSPARDAERSGTTLPRWTKRVRFPSRAPRLLSSSGQDPGFSISRAEFNSPWERRSQRRCRFESGPLRPVRGGGPKRRVALTVIGSGAVGCFFSMGRRLTVGRWSLVPATRVRFLPPQPLAGA